MSIMQAIVPGSIQGITEFPTPGGSRAGGTISGGRFLGLDCTSPLATTGTIS